MAETQHDEQQIALINSLRALSGGRGAPLEAALAQFLNGEGALAEVTRAATTEGGKEIAVLVKFLVDQFNIPPSMATIIATLLIRLAPTLFEETPKKRKKKPATKPKKKPAAKKKPATEKPAPKKTTAKKKPTAKKPAAPKKPAAKKKPPSTAQKRKPASKKTPATPLGASGDTQ